MANNDCWIEPTSVRNEFKEFFSEADTRLSSYFEEELSPREEHIESRLLTLLETLPIHLYLNRINQERAAKKLGRLQIKFKHITKAEGNHGADLGLVARFSIPREMELSKAVLIQGKRLYPFGKSFNQDCVYSELFKKSDNIKPQWERMQAITPSSVYFLYNPDRMRISNSIKPLRTRVMSAQMIEGMSKAGRYKLTAKEAFNQGKTFSSWIVDDFLCCGIGDSNPAVIETALGNNQDFSVRHSIQIDIEGDNNLFIH